jgi:ankyrin repeat protein
MVTFLVEKFNADVNFATEIGETPLVAAVKRDHIRVIRYLLEHGADPNFISSIGLSVL